ncbi:GMP/IMP nucleotidase [Microbulbifer thermotolerans]|uniref:GMP/IMP nucleotidase n=1 Tax=Microbulbifer thermotolerans TaxID=252514 RepID=A0A143HPT6_MICTH|nr:GMP/IMP nucleotidase [Microbulbifer thermotolerans]AMX03755.1 haloacid dehalogenase [Microbulbifer thermotolerans]MCX2783579.1 GMP/IMP nucleotidase [Microbulbifer thermotolerans]MCX2795790.1 GMP/IMP nucleotidase [Microbulbifer thermotolerans]MCX2801954.1 GMP/IMP nucleotidase [Microbulbifer thermotolerans]MCX2833777.1 GMP/IMP nucleotidase [Microbulbifer thermotolerans]
MLDWREIDTVLLDMDGTLLDLHYDNHFWLDHLPKRYAEIHSLPLDRAQRQLHEEIEALRGTLEWYCLDYWERKLQLDLTEMLRETEDRIALRPQTESFLEGLQKLNKNVYLVTNSHPRGLEHKLEISGIDRWLDGVVSSHDLGHAKEHPDFWAALSKTIVFDADRTLFVDDNESVLAAARDYGIGQLLCIRQPDSRGPLREITDFPAIHQFDEIMAIQETSD